MEYDIEILIDNLTKEFNELESKIKKLSAFLDDVIFTDKISSVEYELLKQQHMFMEKYSSSLYSRISLYKSVSKFCLKKDNTGGF